MSNNEGSEGFQLFVETQTYREGIRTRDAGTIDDKTSYGLEKLAEALYISANACADRHAKMAIRHENGMG